MVKKGYKQTEIGVIPEDWSVTSFDRCGDYFKGSGISMRDVVPSGIPCIMYGDIYVKFNIYFSQCDYRITSQTAQKSTLAKSKDLFFTASGETAEEIGKCVSYQGDEDIYIGGDIIALRPSKEYCSLYLAYVQNSAPLIKQKASFAQGHSVVHISTDRIKETVFPCPLRPEQERIAEALSDMDALIASLEKLIAKKKSIKQGAMQELLTGKRRLPGFSGEWKTVQLKELATDIRTGSRNNEEKCSNGKYPFFVRSQNIERIDRYSFDCEAILVPGEGNIGSVFHYINGKFDCHQRVYKISNFNGVDAKYIFYYMQQFFGKYALSNTVKATVDSLRLPTFQEFQLKIPNEIIEQKQIACCISDLDIEVILLAQKLEKARQIKQGMMQQLLTGNIRLV